MRILIGIAAGSALLVLTHAAALSAQQPPEPAGVSVTYESSRDRFHYRFENPSTFDTAELVSHEFTQTYWGDNQWLVVRGRFKAGTRLFETELAATPQRSTRGDDYDTFFQPSGDIVVAGTTGNVSLRSWRARQTIGLGRKGGVDWSIGYQYRRDHSEFHPGLKSTTHTQPPSSDSFWIYTRETTISENYGLELGAARRWTTASGWTFNLGLDGSPLTNARLTTLLPDKYPGETIVFMALVTMLRPRVSITYGSRWPVTLSAGYTRTFSYLHSRQFQRDAASVGAGIGWRSR